LQHEFCRLVGGLEFHAAGAGFAVLAHADFHLVVFQAENGLAGGGMGGGGQSDGEGSGVALHAFGDGETLVEVRTFFGGGASYFVNGKKSDESAAVVRIGAAGDVFVGDDFLDVEFLALRQGHGHVGGEDVAGVIEHNKENAGAAVGDANGLETTRGAGGGEDFSGDADVQHAFTDEAAQAGLVPTAA
jgi:hypothetical protein